LEAGVARVGFADDVVELEFFAVVTVSGVEF